MGQFVKVKDEEGKATEENKGFGFILVSSEHLADTMSIQHAALEFNGHSLRVKKSDRDGNGGYGGYDGYGWGGYGYYDSYGMYPQYGVSSAVRGRGGKGGRGGSRGGKRFAPYAKEESS